MIYKSEGWEFVFKGCIGKRRVMRLRIKDVFVFKDRNRKAPKKYIHQKLGNSHEVLVLLRILVRNVRASGNIRNISYEIFY